MRAHSVARLRRVLCAAQPQREGCGTRASPSDSPRPFFPLRLALLDDAKGRRKTDRVATVWRMKYRSVCFASPSCSAEQRSGAGGSRRGLSEGEARVPQPPGRTSSAGQPAKPAAQRGGRLFFGFFLLATQKKECPRVRRGKQSVPPPSHLSKPIPKSCPVQSATSRLPPGPP